MQITATDDISGVSDDVTVTGGVVDDRLTGVGDDHHSLETLCQVWRQSSTDPVPRICSNFILHLDTSDGECQSS